MPFSNSTVHNIDTKKRLFIPAKYRQDLGEQFYLYYDDSLPCITVFNEEEYNKKSEIVQSSGDPAWQRFFFSHLLAVKPDKQGRITVDTAFCEGAGLKKEVAVVGVGNRLELWNAEKYEAEMKEINASAKRFPNVIY